MGKTRMDLAIRLTLPVVVVLLSFKIFLAATHADIHERVTIPPDLRNRLSPLSRQQALFYGNLIERAAGSVQAMSESVLYEFCTTARLLCSVSLQQSTWGLAMGPESMSLNPRSVTFYKGWASKTKEPLPSASKTGMGDLQAEAAIGDFVPWKGSSRADQPEGIRQYFREAELMAGTQLLLPSFLYQPTNRDEINKAVKPSFLPASTVLDLPPFDISHLKDLLQLFHIPLNMSIVQKLEETLTACAEAQSPAKEDSIITSSCATSFEAMLKFVASMLGAPDNNKMQALTNSKVVGSEGSKVTILWTKELAAGHDTVDCHELTFLFAVMGCHRIKESKAMVMKVADEEGNDMDLLVACHENTALFNPQHEAFSQLQSSPGHTEICHFLHNTDIMWIPL